MKAISTIKYGASKKILRLFYTSYIRPKISYAGMLFKDACNSNLGPLQKLQNECLRLILGAWKTTPIVSLEAETQIMPLNLYLQNMSSKYYLRSLYKPDLDNGSIRKLKEKNERYLMQCKLPNIQKSPTPLISTIPPWQSMSLYIQEHLPAEAESNVNFSEYVTQTFPDHLYVYTDGSKICEPYPSTAAGLYLPSKAIAINWRLRPDHSIVSAELFAILQGLKMIQQFPPQDCVLFTDSKAALQMIQSSNRNPNNLVEEIKIILICLNEHQSVTVHWIKAHANIEGNEIADKIAKEGHNINKSVLLPLSLIETLTIMKRNSITLWNDVWKSTCYNSGKGMFTLQLKNNIDDGLDIEFSDRRLDVAFNRLRLGHVGVGTHLYRFGLSDNSVCDFCLVEDNIEHYLMDCDMYTSQRMNYFLELSYIIRPLPNVNVQFMLQGGHYSINKRREVVTLTAEYIKSTGRINKL